MVTLVTFNRKGSKLVTVLVVVEVKDSRVLVK